MIGRFLNIILSKIKKILHKNAKKRQMQLCSRYIEYDASTNIDHLTLEIRTPADRKFMKIGSNSLIGGSFVFERETGFVSIGERTAIGMSSFMSIDEIKIGNDVMISWGCTFIDNNSHSIISYERATDVLDWKRGVEEGKGGGFYKNWDKVKTGKIIIEDKAWIGFNCIVVKGVTIGEGAVVGAGSVVLKDVPPYTLVMGNPAKAVWKTK